MPDTTTEAWGVTVDQVVALAAQADVRLAKNSSGDYEVQPPANDPDFGGHQSAAITRRVRKSDVEQWVKDAATTVDIVLVKRRRLGTNIRAEFETAFGPVTAVLAAAYLVDAAYPQRSGVNDQASYGHVLWTRYRSMIDDLKEALDDLIDSPPDDDDDTTPRPRPRGRFPQPIFTDEWVRDSTPDQLHGGGPAPAEHRWDSYTGGHY